MAVEDKKEKGVPIDTRGDAKRVHRVYEYYIGQLDDRKSAKMRIIGDVI
jgi:hypothetical protein